MFITASTLYDYMQCPHRVWRDRYGPQDERIKENPFVELLWSKGIQHEKNIITKIGVFVDISEGTLDERFEKTISEMKKGTDLIHQGVLKYNNLLGIPDLLKKLPDNSYIPIDIKLGKGFEETSDDTGLEGKPKKHYAVQLCLYVDLLKILGFAKENKACVIDISGSEVEYLLDQPQGKNTPFSWWNLYEKVKDEVTLLIENKKQNKPAFGGICKLCHWYTSCRKWCETTKDLTNIFYLGRSKRDTINNDLKIESIDQFVNINIENISSQKKSNKNFLKGIGLPTLIKLLKRANIIIITKKPVIYESIKLPKVQTELFLDIEDDPTQNFVYLHGVYIRKKREEKFIPFLAKENTREEEKDIFKCFWDYIHSLPQNDYAVYYYATHEKTINKKLQKLYPDVISESEIEQFFESANVIDLYSDIICNKTDWPLSSYSLKDLASFLGFKWRDETPSGALSIQWYNEYLETKNKNILTRILEYNEDDCKATMLLKDEIEKLSGGVKY